MSSLPDAPEPPSSPAGRLPRNVWLLGWTSLINDTASEMVAPLLPFFLIVALKGSAADLGLIEGCADSAASILKLFAGGWSDRAGRRKRFVVFGYSLPALVRPFLAWAVVPWHVLAIRLGDRIGKGVRTAPRDALIADSTDARMHGRAFGLHRAMDHLGAALGPLAAAAFLWARPEESADDLRALFLIALIPGLLVVLLTIVGLKEEAPRAHAGKRLDFSLRHYPRDFRLYLAALLVFTLGNSSDLFLLARAGELGIAEPLLPILWFAFHLAKSAGNLLGGHTVDRIGAKPLLVAGWLWYAAIYFGFALASSAWHIWALFILYAVYYALTEPSEKTLVAQLAGSQRTGLAYGWYNLLMGVAALPASYVFGLVYDRAGPLAAFGLGAALAAAAVGLLLLVQTPKTANQSEPNDANIDDRS
ncbi:MAG TPA: MFS transporter [Pirellulales bacterium]|nr:MFS transporter [Pirellulales bacterium]